MMIERLLKIRSEAQIPHQTLAKAFCEKVILHHPLWQQSKERHVSDINFCLRFLTRNCANPGERPTQSYLPMRETF